MNNELQETRVNETIPEKGQEWVDKVYKAAAHEFGCTVSELKGEGSKKHLRDARAMVGYILQREFNNWSKVGRFMNLHHSTIMYYDKNVSEYVKRYPEDKEHFENILKAI